VAGAEDFDAWYLRAHSRVAAAVAAMTGDIEIAGDAADEAFTRAYERWPRLSVSGSPDGWAFTVAMNVARRRLRRRRLEDAVMARQRLPEIAAAEAHPELWAAVRRLPPRQRQAIALRYLGDLTEAETAQVMHVSVGAASATLATARQTLKRALRPAALDRPTLPERTESTS